MRAGPEPRGLPFITKIARLVCDEYGFTCRWTHDATGYEIIVDCGPRKFTVSFHRDQLIDAGSDDYHLIAENFLEKLLTECRSARDAATPHR